MDADQNADRDADEKSNDGVEGHRLDSIQVQLCKERSCPATNGSSSTTTTKEKVTNYGGIPVSSLPVNLRSG